MRIYVHTHTCIITYVCIYVYIYIYIYIIYLFIYYCFIYSFIYIYIYMATGTTYGQFFEGKIRQGKPRLLICTPHLEMLRLYLKLPELTVSTHLSRPVHVPCACLYAPPVYMCAHVHVHAHTHVRRTRLVNTDTCKHALQSHTHAYTLCVHVGEEYMWEGEFSEHQLRGRAVSAAGLQSEGSHKECFCQA